MSNQNNEESQELKPGRDAVKTGKNIADIANFAASGTNPISAAKSAADIGKGIKNKADEKKNKFKNNARKLNNYVADLNNMPINSNSRMGGNKSNQNNKKGENQDAKGVLDRAKRLLKKKRLKAIKRRIRMVRRIIRFIAGLSVFVFMSVGIFLLSNPITATILVALGVAQKYGFLGYVAEAWEWCCDALDQVSDWAGDVWDSLTDWIWPSDGHDDGDDDESTSESQYDMQELDYVDQYREALLKNYDLCKNVCEDAYALAKEEAEKIGEDLDCEKYTIVNQFGESLKGKKWDAVYRTEESYEGAKDGINWGNLIIAMDICYSAENKTHGVNENNQYETVDYDPNVLEDYMEENKDSADCNLRCLYHIHTVQISKDEYNIEIIPFDITDLYEIGSLKPEDMFDSRTTFYDMIDTRQKQLANVLASEEVYETLGLYNETQLKVDRKDVKMGNLATGNVTIDSIASEGTNKEKIWQALIDDGFTEIGAAAFMGNLQAENGFKTNWSGDQGSVGLCQWRGERKTELVDLATTLQKEPTDIDVQIYYILNFDFPKHNGGHYEDIKNATDITVATDRVCAEFEKPASFKNYEAWYKGKYSTDTSVPGHAVNSDGTPLIINWKWFKNGYSETYDKYYIHLDRRRAYAEAIYAEFHST